MEKWLEKYRDAFEEQFPLMLCRGMDEDQIIKIIKECVENEKPYEPELNDDANY